MGVGEGLLPGLLKSLLKLMNSGHSGETHPKVGLFGKLDLENYWMYIHMYLKRGQKKVMDFVYLGSDGINDGKTLKRDEVDFSMSRLCQSLFGILNS